MMITTTFSLLLKGSSLVAFVSLVFNVDQRMIIETEISAKNLHRAR